MLPGHIQGEVLPQVHRQFYKRGKDRRQPFFVQGTSNIVGRAWLLRNAGPNIEIVEGQACSLSLIFSSWSLLSLLLGSQTGQHTPCEGGQVCYMLFLSPSGF